MLKDFLIDTTVSIFPATESLFQRLHEVKLKLNYRLHSKGIILLYHRISSGSGGDPQLLCVSPENFRAHLKLLKRYFIPSSVSDIMTRAGGPTRVAITFDDGYRDNLLYAAPILEELDFPAEFFITAAGLNQKNEFFWDMLEQFFPIGKDWNILQAPQTPSHKRYLEECSIFKTLSVLEREKRSLLLMAELGVTPCLREEKRFLNPDELISLANIKNVTIGGHTMNHVSLANLSEKEARMEIEDCKKCLEQILGHEISSFSYPFGTLADFSYRDEILLKQAGFAYGIANYESPVINTESCYDIPRFLVRDWPVELFAEKIKAVLP